MDGTVCKKVGLVGSVIGSDSEQTSQGFNIPNHGEQIDGQDLVKLINASLVPLIGEKVNELGIVTIGNYTDTFSVRNQMTGQLQPLKMESGFIGDHIAIMLANGRYRVASIRVLRNIFRHGEKTIENIRIASSPISEGELEPDGSSQSISSWEYCLQDQEIYDTGQLTRRKDPGCPYDKVPSKLNIKHYGGNQDERLGVQSAIEGKNPPQEKKAVTLDGNVGKGPLKLAATVAAKEFEGDSPRRSWKPFEEQRGREKGRKKMPLQRLRSMNFITEGEPITENSPVGLACAGRFLTTVEDGTIRCYNGSTVPTHLITLSNFSLSRTQEAMVKSTRWFVPENSETTINHSSTKESLATVAVLSIDEEHRRTDDQEETPFTNHESLDMDSSTNIARSLGEANIMPELKEALNATISAADLEHSLDGALSFPDSTIEASGSPLDIPDSRNLFPKSEEELVIEQALLMDKRREWIVREGIQASLHQFQVEKCTEEARPEEARNPETDHLPWVLVVPRQLRTRRKKLLEEQPNTKAQQVVVQLDHTTLRKLWGLLQDTSIKLSRTESDLPNRTTKPTNRVFVHIFFNFQ
jgi:hypothetical protein